ncbi:MAG: CoA-binding protein [Syntrophales bacterium]
MKGEEEKLMNLETFFKPRTMAVIGVSTTNDRHPANVIYNKNRHRYPVEVFAVNPRGGRCQGECVFTRISEIPTPVELAVIAARAEYVEGIMADCIKNDVKAAVIVSGGFAESGRSDLQERLVQMAREADFPFIGPNCLGIYAPGQADTFFLAGERMVLPPTGHVALISQSGGILVDQMIKFTAEEVGLSIAISIGNKALIRELDLLEALAADPRTQVIVFYIEGFGRNEGRRFVEAVRRCPKPVVVIKAGKSRAGSRAVSSHTASMAGDYEVFSAVLAQFKVLEAKNETELLSFCQSLLCYPRNIEGRVGIVTGSGGHGAVAVDYCSDLGINVPDFSPDVQANIKTLLSTSIQNIAAIGNPIDLTGSAVDDDFVNVANLLSQAEDVDCLLFLMLPYLPGITSDVGARLGQVYQQLRKPMMAYVPLVEKYRMIIDGFEFNGIPVANSIEGAVQMVEALRRPPSC